MSAVINILSADVRNYDEIIFEKGVFVDKMKLIIFEKAGTVTS